MEDFGRDLTKAARLHRRFYSPGFAGRMVGYASRSRAIRSVLVDLVLGRQGYLGLERRLLAALPRFLVESGLGAARASRPPSGLSAANSSAAGRGSPPARATVPHRKRTPFPLPAD